MPKLTKILYVEDNLAEVNLLQQAFEEGNIPGALSVVHNGEDALKYLNKEDEFLKAQRPDIILLDLNLPKKNGFEVLSSVKANPRLRSIPVFIFTGSESRDDINKAYQLHVNGYIRKPNSFSEYVSFLTRLIDFWGHSIILPEQYIQK